MEKKEIETIKQYGHYSVTGPVVLPLTVENKISNFIHEGFNFSDRLYGVVYKKRDEEFTDILVRICSNCQWAFYYGSTYCDCQWQMDEAKKRIDREDKGIIIFAHNHHGKGVGIVDHWKVYSEGQRRGIELVVDAYKQLGFREDSREYRDILDILAHYEIKSMRLMTNAPKRKDYFEKNGIKVKIESLEQPIHTHLKEEYRSKKFKLGHILKVPDEELED